MSTYQTRNIFEPIGSLDSYRTIAGNFGSPYLNKAHFYSGSHKRILGVLNERSFYRSFEITNATGQTIYVHDGEELIEIPSRPKNVFGPSTGFLGKGWISIIRVQQTDYVPPRDWSIERTRDLIGGSVNPYPGHACMIHVDELKASPKYVEVFDLVISLTGDEEEIKEYHPRLIFKHRFNGCRIYDRPEMDVQGGFVLEVKSVDYQGMPIYFTNGFNLFQFKVEDQDEASKRLEIHHSINLITCGGYLLRSSLGFNPKIITTDGEFVTDSSEDEEFFTKLFTTPEVLEIDTNVGKVYLSGNWESILRKVKECDGTMLINNTAHQEEIMKMREEMTKLEEQLKAKSDKVDDLNLKIKDLKNKLADYKNKEVEQEAKVIALSKELDDWKSNNLNNSKILELLVDNKRTEVDTRRVMVEDKKIMLDSLKTDVEIEKIKQGVDNQSVTTHMTRMKAGKETIDFVNKAAPFVASGVSAITTIARGIISKCKEKPKEVITISSHLLPKVSTGTVGIGIFAFVSIGLICLELNSDKVFNTIRSSIITKTIDTVIGGVCNAATVIWDKISSWW